MAQLLILALAQQADARRVPRNRLSTPRCNSFNLSDDDFVKNFRLSKQLTFRLIQELKPFLEPKTSKKTALSTEIKVLCALNFFACGCYQRKVGNDFHILISQQSVSNCIRQVSDVMSRYLLRKYVTFPDDLSGQMTVKEEFFNYCGLGGVLGAIDCTHIAIVAPPNDGYHNEKNYVNRKGFHSMNVQLVCDMNMRILNVVARFPGCSHDCYVWQSSNLKKSFDSGSKIHGDGWLLGDSGYGQETHLHVPYSTAAPGSSAEEYNIAHARGRCVIERCNGVLKNRFRCLLKARTLHYMPEVACRIINSCIILHNMCIEENLTWTETDLPEEDVLFDTNE